MWLIRRKKRSSKKTKLIVSMRARSPSMTTSSRLLIKLKSKQTSSQAGSRRWNSRLEIAPKWKNSWTSRGTISPTFTRTIKLCLKATSEESPKFWTTQISECLPGLKVRMRPNSTELRTLFSHSSFRCLAQGVRTFRCTLTWRPCPKPRKSLP